VTGSTEALSADPHQILLYYLPARYNMRAIPHYGERRSKAQTISMEFQEPPSLFFVIPVLYPVTWEALSVTESETVR
jgi:hypothetical protein